MKQSTSPFIKPSAPWNRSAEGLAFERERAKYLRIPDLEVLQDSFQVPLEDIFQDKGRYKVLVENIFDLFDVTPQNKDNFLHSLSLHNLIEPLGYINANQLLCIPTIWN